MSEGHYDLAVLGAGPGGMAAALAASSKGMKTVLVDGGPFLGYGLHGSYKSKAMWELAKDRLVARRSGFGYAPAGEEIRFGEIHDQLEKGVKELTDLYMRYLSLKNVTYVRGLGRFLDPHTVEANGERISAPHFIIATGSRPRFLPGVQVDGDRIMTSDHIVNVRSKFDSLIVIGAGVLGCEFASIFSAMGLRVVLVDKGDRLMNQEDPDVSEFIAEVYRKNRVELKRSARVQSVQVKGGKVETTFEDGSQTMTARALIAVGRVPASDTLNLSAAGVETEESGIIPVNENLQTNVSHVYAVGDVGYRNTPLDLALVQVAEAEGRMAVKDIWGERIDIHPDHIPFIIFTMPMIAGAGLTETQARKRDNRVRVAKIANMRNHRYHAMRYFEGFLKLVVGHEGDDRILGVRAVGPQAESVIGEVSVLIDHGIPYTYLLECVRAHPSLAESLQNAAKVISGLLPPAL